MLWTVIVTTWHNICLVPSHESVFGLWGFLPDCDSNVWHQPFWRRHTYIIGNSWYINPNLKGVRYRHGSQNLAKEQSMPPVTNFCQTSRTLGTDITSGRCLLWFRVTPPCSNKPPLEEPASPRPRGLAFMSSVQFSSGMLQAAGEWEPIDKEASGNQDSSVQKS
jgi:hypothetical protein